ncbi:hypothetical protein HHI36_022075 [Cryptolaemus montrouzieri]|uniref:Glutathione S-transferase n=1 Tax=Cryptolaemus montrouzieri TaxID=559131 RepID=A0ABD2MYZ7_9CUCU
MAPSLYMLPGSPPVRAVLITAKELGVELNLKSLDLLVGDHLKEEFIKINPAHTIPTLDDDGFILWESAAIMCYLVSKYGKKDSLYPKDINKRATIDQLLHLSTSSFSSFLNVFRPIIVEKKKKSTITQENIDKLFKNIDILEKILGDKKYLTGDDYTLADFSFISWISTADTAYPVTEDRFPKVKAWWKRLEELPCYEVNREGVSMFANIWASRD